MYEYHVHLHALVCAHDCDFAPPLPPPPLMVRFLRTTKSCSGTLMTDSVLPHTHTHTHTHRERERVTHTHMHILIHSHMHTHTHDRAHRCTPVALMHSILPYVTTRASWPVCQCVCVCVCVCVCECVCACVWCTGVCDCSRENVTISCMLILLTLY